MTGDDPGRLTNHRFREIWLLLDELRRRKPDSYRVIVALIRILAGSR